ncbi:MAG: Na+/H+ antiporter subunit C [Burkholderiaceae bacterium]|jgi:multicomponent K+:H+ antiporter subunit C|nr:Na+/H+ antiporter subunit C [Burkholderiaceae bacterium]
MEQLLSLTVGVLTGTGVYLLLRARTFDVILGLTLISYAVNVFIFLTGRIAVGKPPIIDKSLLPTLANYADPLPQALVLTAIVISFATTALMLVIALRTHAETGSDHVDGVEPAAARNDAEAGS